MTFERMSFFLELNPTVRLYLFIPKKKKRDKKDIAAIWAFGFIRAICFFKICKNILDIFERNKG
jgi:hypothetical protein